MSTWKERNYAMKKSIVNKKIPKIMLGFLFIGGVAFILGIFRAAKNNEYLHQQPF
jgi:hypothetical protein